MHWKSCSFSAFLLLAAGNTFYVNRLSSSWSYYWSISIVLKLCLCYITFYHVVNMILHMPVYQRVPSNIAEERTVKDCTPNGTELMIPLLVFDWLILISWSVILNHDFTLLLLWLFIIKLMRLNLQHKNKLSFLIHLLSSSNLRSSLYYEGQVFLLQTSLIFSSLSIFLPSPGTPSCLDLGFFGSLRLD